MSGEDSLRPLIEKGFQHLEQRLDDLRDVGTERHVDNLARFAEQARHIRGLEASNVKAHHLLTEHREQIKTIFRQMRDQAAKSSSPMLTVGPAPIGSVDQDVINVSRLKWYLACFSAGAGAASGGMFALLKILKVF
jgi:hypothetical protein